MIAIYVDKAQTLVAVTLAPGEVLNGESGPGTWQLGSDAAARFVEDAKAKGLVVAPYAAPPAPPRSAAGSDLRTALKAQGLDVAWQTALTGQSQDTRDWWTSGYRDLIPIDAKKLVRVAAACAPPVDLDMLFTSAGA